MKLHYKGKYDLNPQSLPCGEHKPGAVKFKEAESSAKLSVIANVISMLILFPMLAIGVIRHWGSLDNVMLDISRDCIIAMVITLPFLFIHELIHAICFKGDVYLYTNWKQAMLFVVGPEDMSKGRFIFMSLLPNIILGLIPYIIGLIIPDMLVLTIFGVIMTSSGAGDYYNVFNAATQMPKGARTYLHGFNSYWFMPKN